MTQPRRNNAVKSRSAGELLDSFPNARHLARIQDLGAWEKKGRQRNDADEMIQAGSIVHEGNVCRLLTATGYPSRLVGMINADC
jgi:hypothetical protein